MLSRIGSRLRHSCGRYGGSVLRSRSSTTTGISSRLIHATRWNAFGVVPFKLADIGEGIVEVEIIEWYVKEGDEVKQFDKICAVQSDKASLDITSRYDGKIKNLGGLNVGDLAKVGETLVEIEVEGATTPQEEVEETPAQATSQQEEEAKPGNEEDIEEPIHARVLERSGSFSVDPVLRPPEEERSITNIQVSYDTEKILATPAVRRLCKDHNIDLQLIRGSGKGGRVLKGDVLSYIANVPIEERRRQGDALKEHRLQQQQIVVEEDAQAAPPSTPVESVKIVEKLAQDVVVPIKGIQRLMVKSMEASLTIPHFNYMEEYNINELVEFRKQLKSSAEAKGLKLSYMPILIKAASLSLVHFPNLNAHINADCSEVIQKSSHNIGVAMDTPRGLLVPTIKDVQDKSIMDITADLMKLQELGANNKLGESELTGGTFTLSNIGAIGGTYASPIIPSPTVAIGAIGRIQTVPKFRNEDDLEAGVYASKVMNISWAADHRVVDGASMARFSNQLKEYIESPLTMVSDLA